MRIGDTRRGAAVDAAALEGRTETSLWVLRQYPPTEAKLSEVTPADIQSVAGADGRLLAALQGLDNPLGARQRWNSEERATSAALDNVRRVERNVP